jgi:transposase
VAAVVEQHAHGLRPATLIGDAAYSNGRARKALKAQGTDLVAPLRSAPTQTRTLYPKRLFHYDRTQNTLTCPAGVTVQPAGSAAPHSLRKFHFPLPVCGACPRRSDCTQAKDGRRSVGISDTHEELCAAEAFNRTAAFQASMKLRPPIEGKLSELVRYHGLRRARYRTLVKVRLQCYFTAAAVNIKRWIALLAQPWTVGNGDPVPAGG